MRSPSISVAARMSSTMLSALKTSRPMPSPMGTVTPGARNLRGASRNEMASTMPSHTKVTAVASDNAEVTVVPRRPLPQQGCGRGPVS